MKYKFLIWLYKLSKRKLQEMQGCSVKCPICGTWSWETNGVESWDYNDEGDLAIMRCKKCHKSSNWKLDHALPYSLE